MIIFTIPGNPKAQKRHRSGKWGNYDPSADAKKDFLLQVMNNRPGKPLTGAISLDLTFHMSRPKNHFGTGRNANKLKNSAPSWCLSKPDVDNLAKFVMDALNGVYWRDDSQIWELNVRKLWANDSPRTDVIIWES